MIVIMLLLLMMMKIFSVDGCGGDDVYDDDGVH